MKLTDLEPELIRWEDRVEPSTIVPPEFDTGSDAGVKAWRDAGAPTMQVVRPVTYLIRVEKLDEAQGLEFICPKCADGHSIHVAFRDRGVIDHHGSRDGSGKPTRWAVSGSSFEDLTLSPSVDCTIGNPKCWHGHIIDGQIVGGI